MSDDVLYGGCEMVFEYQARLRSGEMDVLDLYFERGFDLCVNCLVLDIAHDSNYKCIKHDRRLGKQTLMGAVMYVRNFFRFIYHKAPF